MNLLTLLIFTPIVTAGLLTIKGVQVKQLKVIMSLSSLLVLLLSLKLLYLYQPDAGLQFEELIPWIENYGINYHIGVDGFSLAIMMLISTLLPLTYIFMFDRSSKGMFIAMLLAQGGATGALFSLDMMLFYLFWETMLLPIFIMIGLYGLAFRQKVAIRLTLYTIFGSLAMLFSIIVLAYHYFNTVGMWSFNLHTIAQFHTQVELPFWIYLAFLIAFLIKIPLFGFHGWLKSSYECAPEPTLIILSGIMAKLGVYTIYRFIFILFPQEVMDSSIYIISLGLFGMLYFGVTALMQKELRSMFAYSSASHMSLIVVGLFTLNIYGQSGALYLISAHALGTGGLFLILAIIYEQSQTTQIDDHSGIIHHSPWLGVLFVLLTLSIVGIPGSSGFVAELLIIIGSFHTSLTLGLLTTTTLLVAMTFSLWMLQRMVFGDVAKATLKLTPLNMKDGLILCILVLIIFIMGVAPDSFISTFEPTLQASLQHFKGQQ